jgi:hypothetical protein
MAEKNPKSVLSGGPAPIPPQPEPKRAPPKTPRQRFLALGKRRIEAVEKVLRMVRRFANPRQYEVTEAERARILSRLKAAYEETVRAFTGGKKEDENGWVFDPPS